ncbi:MAG: hypothetical protein MJZ87_05420 [Bacteroidales bacterium]|nr:hypothetical protein [Bacteroidales bacterium]
MESLSEIRKSIQKMSSGGRTCSIFTAKVERVDGDVCEVDYEGLRLTDVQLRAVADGVSGRLLVTPKVGSYVTVADLSGDLTRTEIIGYSELDKIEIACDGDIVFNGGSLGGLIKIEDLVSDLMNIVTTFNAHTHTLANGVTTVPPMQMNPITRGELEDTKIKH